MSEGERSDRQLERLLEVGRALVSELDLETVLRQVLEAARDLTGARYAALGVLDEGREELERFITLGIDDETRAAIGSLPRGHGVLGELIRHPRTLRLADVSTHPRSYGFPPAHPPMHTFLGVPIVIGGEPWGNLYLAEKATGEFDESDERVVGLLTEWAAVAINNARLYEQAETRRVGLARALRGLEVGGELARAVTAGVPFERLTELITKRARDLVDAGSVVLLLPEGEDLILVAATATGPVERLGARIAASEPLLAQALGGSAAMRFGHRGRGELALGSLGIAARWFLLAPLEFRDRRHGLLVALDQMDGGEFDREDERLIGSFASSAATTLATAQSVEAEKLHLSIEASERERRRWAHELHDQTLQDLGSLRLMCEALEKATDWDEVQGIVGRATEDVDRASANLRTLITELRPPALDEFGVGPAIDRLVTEFSSRHDVPIDAEVDLPIAEDAGRGRLSADVEVAIYRTVQEALNNAVQHAEPDRIELRVLAEDDSITVAIRDDGRGFDPASVSRGFGLVGMRERVSLVRGSIRIKSSPGAGTAIEAKLPAAPATRFLRAGGRMRSEPAPRD